MTNKVSIIKSLIMFVFISLLLTSCDNKRFSIKCNIQNTVADKAYLIHVNPITNNMDLIDSSYIEDNVFNFSGELDYPTALQIRIGTQTTINLIADNADIHVFGSAKMPDEIKIKGSKNQNDFDKLAEIGTQYESKKNFLWTSLVNAQKDSVLMNNIKARMASVEDSMLNAVIDFVHGNPKSIGAAYYVYYLALDRQIDIKRLEPAILLFDNDIEGSEYVSFLKDELILATSCLKEGDDAPSFNIKTINNSPLTLKSFQDSYLYILFTFYSNDNQTKKAVSDLENLYDKYIDRNLYFLSVYLNKNKFEIEQNDRSKWFHVSSFESWETPMTKHYGVNSIPYGVLIDGNSNILSINPTISELDSLINLKTKSIE